MSLKVAIVCDSVPHCFHGGGGVTVYSMLCALRNQGMEVGVVALGSSDLNGSTKETDCVQHLEKTWDTSVEILGPKQGPRGRRRWPLFHDQFPSLQQADAVANCLGRMRPDVVLGYHWNALGALYGLHEFPKLGLVGDPVHLPDLFRGELNLRQRKKISFSRRFRQWLLTSPNLRVQERGMVSLLNDCDRSGAFAAHHAEDLERLGAKECRYYRTPTPDSLVNASTVARGKKLKIMHIGHLKGIATLAGIELLANEILPRLKESMPEGSWEFHLVGGFFDTMPMPLQDRLKQFKVKIRGQISPPDDEFFSSHVVLVPTPIELGIRVRIVTAFSFGSCVVAHVANKRGIPELEDSKNCLLGNSGEELALACIRLLKEPKLREGLERGARKTYENYFSIHSAGGEVIKGLGQIASNP